MTWLGISCVSLPVDWHLTVAPRIMLSVTAFEATGKEITECSSSPWHKASDSSKERGYSSQVTTEAKPYKNISRLNQSSQFTTQMIFFLFFNPLNLSLPLRLRCDAGTGTSVNVPFASSEKGGRRPMTASICQDQEKRIFNHSRMFHQVNQASTNLYTVCLLALDLGWLLPWDCSVCYMFRSVIYCLPSSLVYRYGDRSHQQAIKMFTYTYVNDFDICQFFPKQS